MDEVARIAVEGEYEGPETLRGPRGVEVGWCPDCKRPIAAVLNSPADVHDCPTPRGAQHDDLLLAFEVSGIMHDPVDALEYGTKWMPPRPIF